MTAPQHASFLLFALVFLLLRSSRRGLSPRVDRLARFASFAFGFLVSPILALLFFPALWGFDALRAKRWPSWLLGLEWVGGVALLCLGYLAIWKVSVPSLFLRPVTNHVRLLSIAYWELMLFPLVLVGMAGVLGLLTSLILVLRGRALRPRSRSEIGFLVSGAVTYFFFVSETELQRHFSILACLVMTFLLVRELPSYRVLKRSRAWSRTLGVMAVTGLALHGYFVFSFVGKPSVLSPAFAWEDYFEMNQLVLERFPRLPVLGATDGQRALYFPPVIEVATSYAGPLGAVIHSELGGEKLALLGESTRTGILPLAAKLGYRLVVWGPIEDWVWGKNAREILVGREPALLQRRSVSLYRIVESPGRGTR